MDKTKLVFGGVTSVIVSLLLGWFISRAVLFRWVEVVGYVNHVGLWFWFGIVFRPSVTGILCIILFFLEYFIVDKGKNLGEKIPNQALKYSAISTFISFLYLFIEPYLEFYLRYR